MWLCKSEQDRTPAAATTWSSRRLKVFDASQTQDPTRGIIFGGVDTEVTRIGTIIDGTSGEHG